MGHEVPLALGERRDSVGDGEGDHVGTVDGSEVDAEMSVAEAGTDDGGVLPSLDFIVRGYGARCRLDQKFL